jgi:hypothetical protein
VCVCVCVNKGKFEMHSIDILVIQFNLWCE